jgi:uncharacterized protein YlxW (UPF0749 family)
MPDDLHEQAPPGPGPEGPTRGPMEGPAGTDPVTPSDETPPLPDEAPGSAGLERLRNALLRPSRAQVGVGLLLAVLGFAAVTQVRTNTTDNSYAGYREGELVDVLSGLTGTSQRAQSEIDRLEATRRRLEADQQAQSAALAAARKQEDELAILAGSVPVTGPGIRVTVTEGPQHVDVDAVLDTIEELRSAGAEAMQVNGKVRLVAQSSVQATPAGLEIDGVELTSPYVVDVIGDPHTLRGALTLRDGPISEFEDSGATVDVQDQKALDITAIHKPGSSQFAQPE